MKSDITTTFYDQCVIESVHRAYRPIIGNHCISESGRLILLCLLFEW